MADEKWLEDVDLEDGAMALEFRTYGEDTEIIAEGELSSHFCVVLSGNVKVTRHGRQLAILGERCVRPGELFSQSAFQCQRSFNRQDPNRHVWQRGDRVYTVRATPDE